MIDQLRIAIVIASHVDDSTSNSFIDRVLATAEVVVGTGHAVTLLVPCFNRHAAMRASLFARRHHAISIRTFDLPSEGFTTASPTFRSKIERARDSIWTRVLREVPVECVIHPICSQSCNDALALEILENKVVVNLVREIDSPSDPLIAKRIRKAFSDFTLKPEPNFYAPKQGVPTDANLVVPLLSAEQASALVAEASKQLELKRLANPLDPSFAYWRLIQQIRALHITPLLKRDVARVAAFNEGPHSLPQLLLDISVIVHGDAGSGIQRVVRNLLVEFLKEPPSGFSVRPIYFWGGVYRYADNYVLNILHQKIGRVPDAAADCRQGDTYLALDLNTHLVDTASEVHKDMRAKGVVMQFIVYDILLVRHPEWWKPGTSEPFEKWLRSIAQVADGLVCISEAVADDVRDWLSELPSNENSIPLVRSFHLGADMLSGAPSKGLPEGSATLLSTISARPSFLMVGTIEPRKGHAQVLAAMELVWESGADCNLVIVGRPGWLVDDLAVLMRTHREYGQRLLWLEDLSDEFLEQVYAASTCLIAASYGEGFGLPLIESARHGVPILARDIPVFREVAGAQASYFASDASHSGLADKILEWLALFKSNRQITPDTMRWLTWKESAAQLAKAFKQGA